MRPDSSNGWPTAGVVIEGKKLSLRDARAIARAIRGHFALPSVIKRYGKQVAELCGRVEEPFLPQQDYVRLDGWLMSTMSSARYTLDLGYDSRTRTWIQVSLERASNGTWKVTASSSGHAHRL